MLAGWKDKLKASSTTKVQKKEPDPVCKTCKKRLPKINDNLLKDSLRMKSEMNKLKSERHPRAITTMRPEVESEGHRGRNRNIHDNCEQVHTNSRKRDYERWNIPHDTMTDKYLQNQFSVMQAWIQDETLDHSTEELEESKPDENRTSLPSTRPIQTANRTNLESELALIPPITADDDDGDMDEEQRVQHTIEQIRQRGNGGEILRELKNIKDKHAQLEALTQMKERAQTSDSTRKRVAKENQQQIAESVKRDTLEKYLVTKMQLKKEMQFQLFKENTTVSLRRNFRQEVRSKDRGLKWKATWEAPHNLPPGKLHRSTHPQSDARKKNAVKYMPPKLGDIPPCIFLPKCTDDKIPVETATLLDRFVKESESIPQSALQRSKTLPSMKQQLLR